MEVITYGFFEVRQLNSSVRTARWLLPGYTRQAHVIMPSFECWEPQLSKKYIIEIGHTNISGSIIFKLFENRLVLCCTAAGGIQ
jgi:hypothetical protein